MNEGLNSLFSIDRDGRRGLRAWFVGSAEDHKWVLKHCVLGWWGRLLEPLGLICRICWWSWTWAETTCSWSRWNRQGTWAWSAKSTSGLEWWLRQCVLDQNWTIGSFDFDPWNPLMVMNECWSSVFSIKGKIVEAFRPDLPNLLMVSNGSCSNIFSIERKIFGAFALDPPNPLMVLNEGWGNIFSIKIEP